MVTGSSTGIGHACAVALDREGFHVLAGVRKDADGAPLKSAAAGIEPVIVDVTNPATIDALRQEMQPFGVNVAIIEPGSVATPIWDKGLEGAEEMRAALGDEVNRLYGERLDAFEGLAKKTGAAGVPPQEVAEAVTHALTADRPKTRYVVGRDAKAQLAMKAVLPDRALDRLIARLTRG